MSGQRRDLPGASRAAIRDHYDVGNDFFALFLDDETRTYSCALYEPGDDLARAQLRKHDWHIDRARARGSERVLDVGCGWGGMLNRLARTAGVREVVGLTLSEEQKKYVELICPPNVEVHLGSWADHDPPEPYDAIVSMGAFEHFARFKIDPREKIENYRRYFRRCHELLRPKRWMTLQTMAYGTIPRDRVWADEFIANEIFRESDFPRLADIAEASEGLFEVVELRNDREQYTRTYREWFNRLRERRDEGIALVGKEACERYERYLRLFSYSFDLGSFDLLRIAFRRIEVRP